MVINRLLPVVRCVYCRGRCARICVCVGGGEGLPARWLSGSYWSWFWVITGTKEHLPLPPTFHSSPTFAQSSPYARHKYTNSEEESSWENIKVKQGKLSNVPQREELQGNRHWKKVRGLERKGTEKAGKGMGMKGSQWTGEDMKGKEC